MEAFSCGRVEALAGLTKGVDEGTLNWPVAQGAPEVGGNKTCVGVKEASNTMQPHRQSKRPERNEACCKNMSTAQHHKQESKETNKNPALPPHMTVPGSSTLTNLQRDKHTPALGREEMSGAVKGTPGRGRRTLSPPDRTGSTGILVRQTPRDYNILPLRFQHAAHTLGKEDSHLRGALQRACGQQSVMQICFQKEDPPITTVPYPNDQLRQCSCSQDQLVAHVGITTALRAQPEDA